MEKRMVVVVVVVVVLSVLADFDNNNPTLFSLLQRPSRPLNTHHP
jgi:hypothetical protein